MRERSACKGPNLHCEPLLLVQAASAERHRSYNNLVKLRSSSVILVKWLLLVVTYLVLSCLFGNDTKLLCPIFILLFPDSLLRHIIRHLDDSSWSILFSVQCCTYLNVPVFLSHMLNPQDTRLSAFCYRWMWD